MNLSPAANLTPALSDGSEPGAGSNNGCSSLIYCTVRQLLPLAYQRRSVCSSPKPGSALVLVVEVDRGWPVGPAGPSGSCRPSGIASESKLCGFPSVHICPPSSVDPCHASYCVYAICFAHCVHIYIDVMHIFYTCVTSMGALFCKYLKKGVNKSCMSLCVNKMWCHVSSAVLLNSLNLPKSLTECVGQTTMNILSDLHTHTHTHWMHQ